MKKTIHQRATAIAQRLYPRKETGDGRSQGRERFAFMEGYSYGYHAAVRDAKKKRRKR